MKWEDVPAPIRVLVILVLAFAAFYVVNALQAGT